ncbi:MAG: hypothetical protein KC643_18090 [Nitrospira sp.]|nr:hypothetical protein [Nitrospira sp.]
MEKIADSQTTCRRAQNQTAGVGHSWLLFIINLPLLAEVVRKYAFQKDSIFFGMAIVVLVSFLALLLVPRTRILQSLPLGIWVTILAFYSWAFINEIVASHSLLVFFIGLGTMFLPLTFFLISNIYFRQGEGAVYRVFLCVNCWLILILATGLLQILLGRDHPFTTYGLGSTGIGDYSVEGRVVEGLFRPTSIFTHTGKFGQALFCLILFKWCYFVATKMTIRWFWKISMGLDVLAVVVSGQRAAFVFLCLSTGLLLFYKVSREGVTAIVPLVWYSLSVTVLIVVISLQSSVASSSALILVFERFLSSVYDIPNRLIGNFILPVSTVVDKYLIFGEGLGVFTLGAKNYGGAIVYKAVDMPGLGENSWIRMIAEVGVVGTILYLMMLFQLLHLAFRSVVSRYRQENEPVALFFGVWLGSIMLWANTHDVFGNMIVTAFAFALGGGVLQWKSKSEGLATL